MRRKTSEARPRAKLGYSLFSMLDIGPTSMAEQGILGSRKAPPEPVMELPEPAEPPVKVRPAIVISDAARNFLQTIESHAHVGPEADPGGGMEKAEAMALLPPLAVQEDEDMGTSSGLGFEITGPGGQTSNDWVFGQTTVSIGRSPLCDIQLMDDCKVSRRHLEISLDGDVMRVQDLASLNGTFLQDGSRLVSTAEFTSTFPLRIGDTLIRVSKAMKTDDESTGERSISTTMGTGQISYSMRTPDDFSIVPLRLQQIPIGAFGHSPIRSVLAQQKERVKELMEAYPLPFRISRMIKINGSLIRFGSTMKLRRYDAIPVFITKDDRTCLVFAYQSVSQASWRRYAGYKDLIFWKGKSGNGRGEHFQNFDYRIQRVLDSIYDLSTPTRIGRGENLLDLHEFGLNAYYFSGRELAVADHIISSIEDVIQDGMARDEPPIDLKVPENLPHRLASYWWSGTHDGPWGRYLSLVCESANRDYIFGIAVTEDGMMLQYIQRWKQGGVGVNNAGAPAVGVPVAEEDEWIFTPVFEYASLAGRKNVDNISRVDVIHTVMHGGNRVRVWGLHESATSPFHRLSNGLADLPRMLRREDYSKAEHFLNRIISDGGILPRLDEPPEEPSSEELMKEAGARLDTLLAAFAEFTAGKLDQATEHGRRYAIEKDVVRELRLFKRYSELLDKWRMEFGTTAIDKLGNDMVRSRFNKEAVRWARDRLMGR